MKLLQQLFKFYINSSIHVAFAVCALLGVTVLEFGIKPSYILFLFIFLGTISGYNFVKYAKVAGLHHRSLTEQLRAIQVFSVIAGILIVWIAFYVSITTLIIIGVFGSLTFLYAVPFLNKKNLRSVSGLKIFIVAFVWAGVTVIVPIVSENVPVTQHVWIAFIQRIFLVMVLTFPFEIRDLQYDLTNLKTFAQQFGIKKLKRIGYLLLCLVLIFEAFKPEINILTLLPLGVTLVSVGMLLFYTNTKQSKYYASFWVEGIPIVWVGMLLLFRNLFV